jgi:hypothetical protein
VAEPRLQRPRVVAGVGERIAAAAERRAQELLDRDKDDEDAA